MCKSPAPPLVFITVDVSENTIARHSAKASHSSRHLCFASLFPLMSRSPADTHPLRSWNLMFVPACSTHFGPRGPAASATSAASVPCGALVVDEAAAAWVPVVVASKFTCLQALTTCTSHEWWPVESTARQFMPYVSWILVIAFSRKDFLLTTAFVNTAQPPTLLKCAEQSRHSFDGGPCVVEVLAAVVVVVVAAAAAAVAVVVVVGSRTPARTIDGRILGAAVVVVVGATLVFVFVPTTWHCSVGRLNPILAPHSCDVSCVHVLTPSPETRSNPAAQL